MKQLFKLGTALFAAVAVGFAAPAAAQEKLTVWFTKGLLQGRGRRARRGGQEVRAEDRRQGRALALCGAGHHPEDRRGARCRQAAGRRLRPRLRLPGDRASGRTTASSRTSRRSSSRSRTSSSRAPSKRRILYNDKTKKKAYYAFPLEQQTMHIQYWKDMLAEAGFKETDIPTTWKAYWDFWCDKVQPAHRTKTGKRTYAIGHPMGVDSSDSFYSFLTFMDAYNVKAGRRQRQAAGRRSEGEGRASSRRSRTTPTCTPAAALRRRRPAGRIPTTTSRSTTRPILMTHNATISIASKWLDDSNNASLTAGTARPGEEELRGTHRHGGFPNKPDGSPMIYRAAVKTA